MERRVSNYLRDLPFLWLNVDDEPGAESQRAYIERNMIALLSNYQRETVDARSNDWLAIIVGARKSANSDCGM